MLGDSVVFDDRVVADPGNGNHVSASLPSASRGDRVRLTIRTADGKKLIEAGTSVK
jgi:hypothetical protein